MALIGTINVVLFAAFLLSPLEITESRRKGLEPGAYVRHVPSWVAGTSVMLNFPGAVLAIPVGSIMTPGSWLDSWLPALVMDIGGTLFWGVVAMGVEYCFHGRRSSGQVPR